MYLKKCDLRINDCENVTFELVGKLVASEWLGKNAKGSITTLGSTRVEENKRKPKKKQMEGKLKQITGNCQRNRFLIEAN